jgi:hypothetical protein
MTLALLLFKNSNDTREKLRLDFHSLSVSDLLEYGRMSLKSYITEKKQYREETRGKLCHADIFSLFTMENYINSLFY